MACSYVRITGVTKDAEMDLHYQGGCTGHSELQEQGMLRW